MRSQELEEAERGVIDFQRKNTVEKKILNEREWEVRDRRRGDEREELGKTVLEEIFEKFWKE